MVYGIWNNKNEHVRIRLYIFSLLYEAVSKHINVKPLYLRLPN